MNILTDRHHNSLYNSLRILFEERLGGNLFCQVGIDWADMGYWRIYDHPETRAQYLSLDQRYRPADESRQLNQIVNQSPDYYELYDPEYEKTQKALTFQQFLDTDIDVIIASIPEHIYPFYTLRNNYKPDAKLIYQIGNSWDLFDMPIPNIMASTEISLPEKYHSIQYHQEFDTNIFSPKELNNSKNIYSFVNCFSLQDHFKNDWNLFQLLEEEMSDWSFRAFGGQCRDGAMNGAVSLAAEMAEARFIFHVKNGGDGYGHIIHNAAACGKPLIVKEQYYLGKLGGDLLTDGITCIAIDGLSATEIINKIKHYSEPERYAALCENMYQRFIERVDFNREAESLRIFMLNLY